MTRFKLFNKTATEGSLSKNGFIARLNLSIVFILLYWHNELFIMNGKKEKHPVAHKFLFF